MLQCVFPIWVFQWLQDLPFAHRNCLGCKRRCCLGDMRRPHDGDAAFLVLVLSADSVIGFTVGQNCVELTEEASIVQVYWVGQLFLFLAVCFAFLWSYQIAYSLTHMKKEHTMNLTQTNISRGFGWRIHCSVEVTELSTNKQHTLSLVTGKDVHEQFQKTIKQMDSEILVYKGFIVVGFLSVLIAGIGLLSAWGGR
jgi:hypothetical protein